MSTKTTQWCKPITESTQESGTSGPINQAAQQTGTRPGRRRQFRLVVGVAGSVVANLLAGGLYERQSAPAGPGGVNPKAVRPSASEISTYNAIRSYLNRTAASGVALALAEAEFGVLPSSLGAGR